MKYFAWFNIELFFFFLSYLFLSDSQWENAKLREELSHQNYKFEDVFETLQKEDRDLVTSLAKQKVEHSKNTVKSFVDKFDD